MKTKYNQARSFETSHVQELPTVSATMLKNSISDVFDQVHSSGAVAITRHDKPRAVLLSVEDYEGLKAAFEEPLQKVREHYDRMFERMQTAEQAAGAERAFYASPEDMGRAAVEAAIRDGQ